jgi:predicted  nucleic acid-binding Zn-ribbon protein
LIFGILLLTSAWLAGQTSSWATPPQSTVRQTVPTRTPVPAPQPVNLAVNLQRPNASPPHPSWAVPVHLALSRPGSTGPASYEWDLSLDANGRVATIQVMSAGVYDVRLKNLHTLRNVKRSVLLNGTSVIDMGTLLEGDADSDNRVRAADFALLRTAYFTELSDPGFDGRTDFDEDGRIRSSDFALLRSNYFATGDIEVTGALSRAAAVAPAGTVALALEPSSVQVKSGGVFDLTLMAHANEQPFVAMDCDIRFPPKILQVIDADGQPVTHIEPLGTLTILVNSVNNTTGRILYGAGVSHEEPPLTGDVALARARFRAAQVNATAGVALIDCSVSDSTGRFVTGPLSGSQVTIEPAPVPKYLYLPLVLRTK